MNSNIKSPGKKLFTPASPLLRGIIILIFLGAAAFCAAEGMTESVRRDNEKAELSYAFGMMLGMELKETGFEFNYNSFIRGFREVMENMETRYSIDRAMDVIQTAFERAQTEIGEKNRTEGEAFLLANGERPGVITTPSGLQYEVLVEGAGDIPNIGDIVRVHYSGATIDGNIFDTTYEDGIPVDIPLDRVISGWSEGLRLMREGGKSMFYIPSTLAYGEWGAGQAIGPYATLIFEVDFIAIIGSQSGGRD